MDVPALVGVCVQEGYRQCNKCLCVLIYTPVCTCVLTHTHMGVWYVVCVVCGAWGMVCLWCVGHGVWGGECGAWGEVHIVLIQCAN